MLKRVLFGLISGAFLATSCYENGSSKLKENAEINPEKARLVRVKGVGPRAGAVLVHISQNRGYILQCPSKDDPNGVDAAGYKKLLKGFGYGFYAENPSVIPLPEYDAALPDHQTKLREWGIIGTEDLLPQNPILHCRASGNLVAGIYNANTQKYFVHFEGEKIDPTSSKPVLHNIGCREGVEAMGFSIGPDTTSVSAASLKALYTLSDTYDIHCADGTSFNSHNFALQCNKSRESEQGTNRWRTFSAILQSLSLPVDDVTSCGKAEDLVQSTGALTLQKRSLVDLSPLQYLPSLITLDISGNNVSDLTPLAGLQNLQTLNADGNNISNLQPLLGLSNLNSLSLNQNSRLTRSTIDGLKDLNLRELMVDRSMDSWTAANQSFFTNCVLFDTLPVGVKESFGQILKALSSEVDPSKKIKECVGIYRQFMNAEEIDLRPHKAYGKSSAGTSPAGTTPPAGSGSTPAEAATCIRADVIPVLKDMPGKVFVDLSACNLKNVDLAPLQSMGNLAELNLANNVIDNLRSIENYRASPDVKLSFEGNPVSPSSCPMASRYEDLAAFCNVNYGFIYYCLNPNVAEGIAGSVLALKNLVPPFVDCADTQAKLQKLETINLPGSTIFSRMETLAGFINLKRLNLNRVKIRDLSVLRRMKNLEALFVDATLVEDLTPIAGLDRLRELSLVSTKVSRIPSTANWPELTLFRANLAPLTQIDALSSSALLEKLYLDSTQVRSVEALTGFTQLKVLSLYKTSLKEIDGLENLTNLQTLILSTNEITSVTALGQLRNLSYLEIDHNKIVDLSPLKDLSSMTTLIADGNPVQKSTTTFCPRTSVNVALNNYCQSP